uniref:PDZ domain-containing protein n=1 Tax=Leersia perrieri TaxID=77586 RepID=A0A0D9VWB8_9ORYZ
MSAPAGADSSEPPKKQRAIDPIAPTDHPWNLPAEVGLLHCSCRPENKVLVIPREANLPMNAEARRVVARVSQAVVGVASIDVDGDQLWRASGFVIEFDKSSMIGTVISSATIAFPDPGFPDIEKIKIYLFDGVSYDATIIACDHHWNLLALSVLFDRVIKPIKMVEISESRDKMDAYHGVAMLQPHSTSYKLCPGDTIIGLGRKSEEPFGLQGNRGVYSVERWADLPLICQEMQRATFINTYTAVGGPAINKKGNAIGMLFHSLSFTPFLPSNIILKWLEYFKTTGKYCRPVIKFVGCNLHNARSSRWVKVPASLHEGLDGILVELASREVLSAGLQEKDLIIECNRKRVATNLQLFEVLAENIGKMVEVTIIKAENSNRHSVYLPVEEVEEKCFYEFLDLMG